MDLKERAEKKIEELINNENSIQITAHELTEKINWLENLIDDESSRVKNSDLSNDLKDNQHVIYINLNKLLDLIEKSFNLEELNTICFYLNIDPDDFSVNSKKARARELILECKRRKILKKLIVVLINLNEGINHLEIVNLFSDR